MLICCIISIIQLLQTFTMIFSFFGISCRAFICAYLTLIASSHFHWYVFTGAQNTAYPHCPHALAAPSPWELLGFHCSPRDTLQITMWPYWPRLVLLISRRIFFFALLSSFMPYSFLDSSLRQILILTTPIISHQSNPSPARDTKCP